MRPFDTLVQLPNVVIKCVFEQLTLAPYKLSKVRLERLLEWKRWVPTEARGVSHDDVLVTLSQIKALNISGADIQLPRARIMTPARGEGPSCAGASRLAPAS